MMQKLLLILTLIICTTVSFTTVAVAADEEDSEELKLKLQKRDQLKKEVEAMDSKKRLDESLRRDKSIDGKLAGVQKLLDDTRRNGDATKLPCIVENAMTMKGYSNVSKKSYTAQKEAEQKSPVDNATAAHHFILIAVAYQNVLELESKAKACVGQGAEDVSEEGQLTTEVNDDIVPLTPIFEGGYIEVSEVFDDILDPQKIPELTPLQ